MQIPIKTDHPLNAILLAHADSERINKSSGVYHAPAGKEDHPPNILNMVPPVAFFQQFGAASSPNSKPSIRSAMANLFSKRGNRG